MIITAAKVRQHLSDVSGEQIGLCHKCIQDGTSFYMVESESGEFDTDGEAIEYKVSYDRKGFHCTCKSGQFAFANVKHLSGVCKHVRWAVACAEEEKHAMAEIALEQAQEALKEVAPVVAPVAKPLTKAAKAFIQRDEKRQTANAEAWAFIRANSK